MKKIVIAVLVLLVSTALFAQKSTEIAVSKLPAATTKYINDNLPGAKITKTHKLEENGVVTYGVGIDVKGRTHLLIFDKDGKFLKKGDNLIPSPASKTQPATKPVRKTPATEKAPVK